MKNVTISLDDEVHRKARIRAAEMGTSLSALVKQYLNMLAALGEEAPAPGVRDVPMTYDAHPKPTPPGANPETGPWLVDGKWVWTKDGKPRQPGAMRGMAGWTEDFDETPEWLLDAFEGKDANLPWPAIEPKK